MGLSLHNISEKIRIKNENDADTMQNKAMLGIWVYDIMYPIKFTFDMYVFQTGLFWGVVSYPSLKIARTAFCSKVPTSSQIDACAHNTLLISHIADIHKVGTLINISSLEKNALVNDKQISLGVWIDRNRNFNFLVAEIQFAVCCIFNKNAYRYR